MAAIIADYAEKLDCKSLLNVPENRKGASSDAPLK